MKSYSPGERENAKNSIKNRVRFEIPREKGISGVIDSVVNHGNYMQYHVYIAYLKETKFNDNDFQKVIFEARQNVNKLNPKFELLVKTLLTMEWKKRSQTAINEFCKFYVDILVAHNKYTPFAIKNLISAWIPDDNEGNLWKNSKIDEEILEQLDPVHKLIEELLNIIPLSYDVVLEAIDNQFPYYKKSSHVVGGYLFNILWLLKYKPVFMKSIIEIIFRNFLFLDVNAPRCDIEEAEFEEEERISSIDDCDEKDDSIKHPVAATLDVCMEKMFEFTENFVTSRSPENNGEIVSFFNLYFTVFENVILPSHNTHHIQFLIFYLTSLKSFLAERFLSEIWSKIINPNISGPLRKASVGYMASFLARAKFISLNLLKYHLKEMCTWAYQYVQRSDSVQTNYSLKANTVFFSVCQAIFYVIAFRNKDLTGDKKSILFLQSLQLSALVTCNFNPLRVCIPTVAAAFAEVTRAYQLAYCHAILKRNARRKLATVYLNETSMPEETLETFFPFDPYLLKKSGKKITPIYLQYQGIELEEDNVSAAINVGRKRGDSEIDDVDDFIIDKKRKNSESSRNNDKEMLLTYGISPVLHNI